MHGRNIRLGRDSNQRPRTTLSLREFSLTQLPGIVFKSEMLEGVVCRNTPPLKVIIHLLMTESLTRQKVHFWTTNGINGSMANPQRAPTLRTKPSVTKKQINAWLKYKFRTGFKPETSRTNSQYHNHRAKENSS